MGLSVLNQIEALKIILDKPQTIYVFMSLDDEVRKMYVENLLFEFCIYNGKTNCIFQAYFTFVSHIILGKGTLWLTVLPTIVPIMRAQFGGELYLVFLLLLMDVIRLPGRPTSMLSSSFMYFFLIVLALPLVVGMLVPFVLMRGFGLVPLFFSQVGIN